MVIRQTLISFKMMKILDFQELLKTTKLPPLLYTSVINVTMANLEVPESVLVC